MAKNFLTTILGVFLFLSHGNSEVPKQYEMSGSCGSTISFSDSMVLTIANATSEACNVVIQSNDVNNRLLIDFVEFNFMDNCTETRLSILDDLGDKIAGPLCNNNNLNVTVFKSGGNIARFQYVSQVTDNQAASFSTIITSFNVGIKGKCAPFEFQCDNKLCISEDLVCNSFDECSDDSDETLPCLTSTSVSTTSTNSPGSSPSPGAIVGISVASAFVVILAVAGFLFLFYRRRKRNQNNYGTL